ncbi:MAG: class I SAM-dependent methyltransferase [Methylophilaceae bacterium]|nr:class I SAM-dependent methyltransferase [Methylophilaceae bacterium]
MNQESRVLKSPEDWNIQWNKWFGSYSKGNPRLGKWLHLSYPLKQSTVLEIGAGSGRESRYLATIARSVTCVDFSPDAVNHLSASGLPPNMVSLQANAMCLPFKDACFDLTFHKGVWILFSNDQEIILLLREQLRVTRNLALAVVQNALNKKQIREAEVKARTDPLFRFRFFSPYELQLIAERALLSTDIKTKIRIRKYGSPILSQWLSPLGELGKRIAAKVYCCLPWSQIECAVLEITLKRNKEPFF